MVTRQTFETSAVAMTTVHHCETYSEFLIFQFPLLIQSTFLLTTLFPAMSMYDRQIHVSFQSKYPIYRILETLLHLLKSIECYEADSQKNGGKGGASGTGNISESANEVSLPLHGLDTLKDDVTGAVVKILHAFGRHTIESDFKRIELRPYYENYLDIISN